MGGLWCNIVFVTVQSSEEKSDESKDGVYEESEQVFYHLPKYHMEILFGYLNVKLGREDIFKSTIGNESRYQDRNDNGVRIVNFATSKNLALKSRMFRTETFINTPGLS
jgi:hypothetical protein